MATPRRRELINAFANMPVFTRTQRARILRHAGVISGDMTEIAAGIRVAGTHTLTIGRACYINFDSYFDCEAPITFGDFSGTAVGVKILTSHHAIQDRNFERIATPTIPLPVTIGSRVWVGVNAVILPGINIGDNCVVGAGAIVNKDCTPDGVYVGMPARRIRDITTPAGTG